MGAPAWAEDERFATLLGRKAHEDELERQIAAWTVTLSAPAAAALLQASGVPAAAVASTLDIVRDPQLAHRSHFIALHHPVIGDFPFDALSYRMDGVSPAPPRAAPRLGDDNAAVAQDLLGLTPEAFAALTADGVFR